VTRRLVCASVAALLSGALLGCLEAIAPGSPHAGAVSLAIAPLFVDAGAEAGVPGDVDLIRITLHNPPKSDTTLNFPVAPGQDSIIISIPITLSGGVDTVGVTFQAIRSSDNTVLYSGLQTFRLQPGVPTGSGSPLVAKYVGPGGNIASIAIVPRATTIKPGDTLAFGYTALDSSGATILGMPVLFASRNKSIVTVNVGGVAKGVALGSSYVVLTSGARSSVKDSALVTVSNVIPPSVVSLTGTPGYGVMLPGDKVTYAVTGTDTAGKTVTPAGLSFTSRTPAVATVDATTGVITAVASGRSVIVAQAPSTTGTAFDSTLVVVAASGSAVVAAIGDGRAFDVAAAGGTVKVRVLVDLRGVPGDTLGSYNAQLNWNTAALTYVSSAAVSGGFAAPTLNETQTASGQLRFGSADPTGSAGAFALVEVTFTAAAAGSSPLTLGVTDLSTAKTFLQLQPAAVIVSGAATVH